MRTFLAMQQLLMMIEGRLRTTVHRFGVRVEDLPILALLDTNDDIGMTGSTLADRVGRQRQNVQTTLLRLSRRKLIDSWTDDDGRVGGWTLTDEGRAMWAKLGGVLTELEERVFRTTDAARRTVNHLSELTETLYVQTEPWAFRRQRDVISVKELFVPDRKDDAGKQLWGRGESE